MRPKHPLAIRWFHWLNFPLLSLMIWSGLMIYWANDVYLKFPDWLYERGHLSFRLAEGMQYHFLFMWLFLINGALYVLYTGLSGEWRELVPDRHTAREALEVVRHDLGLRKEPLPPGKFNAAQRLAYTGVIVMGLGSVVTGMGIWKPIQLGWLTALLGGYEAARAEHFALTLGYVCFFLMHIVQVVRAGWPNFKAMVTGHES